MKYLLILLALLSCIIYPVTLEKIAAVIDDEIILESELKEVVMFSYQEQRRAVPSGVEFQNAMLQLLKSMIDDKLLIKEAAVESIFVSHEEIISQRDQQIQGYVSKVGSVENLEIELKKNNMTLSGFKKNLYKQISEQFLKMRLMESIRRKNSLTKKEVEQFYKSHIDSLPQEKSSIQIAHIMKKIKPSKEVELLAIKKMKKIEQKLLSGTSFEKVAAEFSDDPGSASNGGDLGFVSKGFFDKNFENVAFNLNVGDVSRITRSRLGYHIIRLDERRDKEIKVRHILVLLTPNSQDSLLVINLMDSIKTKITTDSLFKLTAKDISDDNLTAHKGGDLGWVSESSLMNSYKNAVSDVKMGTNSNVIVIDNAYHLFRVLGRKESRILTIENDYDIIKKIASNYKLKSEITNICDRMRSKVYIENRLLKK